MTLSLQTSGLSQLPRGPVPVPSQPIRPALIYCEGQFDHLDGKTAHGLVRHCEAYRISAVIDSHCAGLDAGLVLDGRANGIPIVRDLEAALALEGVRPQLLIYGMAPATGLMSAAERQVLLQAMAAGLDLVQGLREFLNDDPEFAAAASRHQVLIRDVRRVPALKDLHLFSGAIAKVGCPRIAVLGTDGAIGKRTTATLLVQALQQAGIRALLVNTGQTGLMQGGRHGIALDAIPSQFCSGEVEAAVVRAWEEEHPQLIVIEGQGALSHPAYLSSTFILRGSQPQAVILQHAPRRQWLSDFSHVAMPTPASEIRLIESFAPTRVIGLTLNHEHMDEAAITTAIALYEAELGIPVSDALSRPPQQLVQMVLKAFPALAPAPTPAPTGAG